MNIDGKLEEIKGGNEQVYEKWAQEFESKKKQRIECEKVYGVHEAARKTKQEGGEEQRETLLDKKDKNI